MSSFLNHLKSSIGKKQIVAATGLCLLLFVVGHLGGNLLFFLGPEAYNGYAHKLSSLRPGLYVIEAALVGIFFIHIWLTAVLVIENNLARPVKYAGKSVSDGRSLSTRLMPVTGTIIFCFIVWHLVDFTFSDRGVPRGVLEDGIDYGLYGVVYNSFANPIHSALYIFAMAALGLHLSHAIQSVAQTFGLSHPKYTPIVRKASHGLGLFIAGAFSSIPLYVLVNNGM